ncbi:sacsin-like [Acanthaster planci]|uniref:Sacsin-like n=1 Tax=Acanthaster planci TaxID=133434 RepID=A0A8B7ZBA8_ACAPL|nr:sacsin-like [Acanthaster planci]XP_022102272.1 sacsin-like [Acanthaster planci]
MAHLEDESQNRQEDDEPQDDEIFEMTMPPLCVYLRRILCKYPQGALLKELVQNADDAKARNVIFLFDRTEHPRDQLCSGKLAEFQGPALCAYNDASFTKEDWKNIQHPEYSSKREDPTKVGRFGLGFISVFHLTDMPWILSQGRIGYLDPLEEHFDDPAADTTYGGKRGKSWKLSEALLNRYPDQFSPFLLDLFSCNKATFQNGKFAGTIFRFPLRKTESKLSSSVFQDHQEVMKLFETFQTDADLSLLFLKNVESIAVYERGPNQEHPRLIFRVQIRQDDRHQVRHNRETFFSKIPERQDFCTDGNLQIESHPGPSGNDIVSKFIIVNSLKSRDVSADLDALIHDKEVKFLPWMGMAFQTNSIVEQNGRWFCFLPLPESEAVVLPVHIHGYFGLSDDRRRIKWPDKESQYDKEARWNHLLVTEVLPEVYAELLLAAIEKSKDPAYAMLPVDVYKGWPCKEKITESELWSGTVKRFLLLLKDKDIFYTDQGRWMKPADIFINTKNDKLISKVLIQKKLPVALLPNHILDLLDWADFDYQMVTPELVRNCIRGDDLRFLTREEKLELLEYVISDCITDLNGLHLLPLGNEEFTSFGENLPTVYIASNENPSMLIPNGEEKFAASDMPAVLRDSKVKTFTQLRAFCITDVAPLLLEMFPIAWRNFSASNTMPWTPGVDKHPSSEWLKMLWQWLSRNHMQLQLSTFKCIPLVPAPTNSITRLRESGLISSNLWSTVDTDRLSENICSFLESIGAIVVRDELPEYMTHHPHLKDFIRSPTPKGVMTILETMSDRNGTEHIYDSILRLSSEAKDELRNLLTQPHWTPTDRQKNILRHVPLFFTSDGHYISAESCRAAVPANYFGIPVSTLNDGSKYIVQRDTSENLSSLVRVISERELLANNILPAVAEGYYELSESVEIMTWVLERPTFDDLTRKAKFIPGTSDTQLLCPDDLYEPIDKLKLLLRGKNVFPTGVYAEGRLLKLLQRFSLKNQSEISSADVLHAALELDKTQETDQADVARGRLLLEHINLHPHLLMENVRRNGTDEKPLHVFLKELHWVPCEASCPHGYPASAGWMGNSRTLYSPTDIGMIEFSLLCGSVRPLVDLANMQEDLLSAFAWKKPDPNDRAECQRVICHLKNISDTHQPGQETHTVSDSVSVIYQFLGEASDPTVAEIFETHLNRSHPWVWHGSGFTTPDKIALSTGSLSISLIPYLHIVPEDMQKYSIFLSKGGVQQTFSVTELCSVLLSVQAKHQPEHVPSEEEYQTDLNLVCNILKYIVDHANVSTVTPDILVPCRTDRGQRLLKMVPPCECLYVDQQRLVQQLYDKDTKEELNKEVIHESISNDVAQRLGLLPLSHFLAPTDEVEYETDGPHITPVNAIKQNLDMYKNNDVFKELIQNADDAGATEVRFLFDWRSNEKTASALLSEGMKTCHGPALWAYNDARFSRHDIRNICSVAAQSKKHQTDKIGRFGLGFTSVYHLTDIPSVVSGPYVLICDPRTIHLGLRVKPGQPGIRIDLTNDRHRRTLRSYPNQFQPYNGIFGCDLTASTKGFDHTLFRLPLRTEFGASSQQPNQLSDFICDTKDRVLPLIESVKKFSSTLLLFTQNVVKVSLHELSENQSGMEDIMSVTVSRLRQLPRSISFNYDTAELKTERGLLFATTECIKDPDLPLPETTMVLKIAHTIHESEEPTESAEVNKDLYFITSSCMAKGDILDLAQTPEGEEDAVLPCGGIAAQLDFGDGDCLMPKAVEGSAFSYLPLSVLTGLPFHINGNFLLQPNRRQLWGKSSSGTEAFEVRWNCCFMETVLCNALLNLLQDLRLLQEQNVVDASNFQTLWPKRKRCDSDFHPLVDAFYRRIGRENSAPAVIVNQGQWLTVHDCFFTEWVATDPQGLRCSIKVVLAENQRPKTHVVLEPEVTTSISEAGANSFLDVNTFSVERFLQQVFFPALVDRRHIEHEHHNEIILHVLDLRLGERKITEYDDHLKTTKCIPVSPHGAKLVTPDYLVDPCAPIASLYSEQDGRFPYGSQYREQARLVSLTELGMASSDLPWEEICKRAESMRIKHQFEQQGMTLLNLMDKKLRNFDQPTPEQQERIRNAPFLPVLEKPKNYPASWFRCDEEMMSAAALFGEGHRDLLGSVKPLLDDKRLGTVATSPQIRGLLGIHEKGILVTDVMQQLAIIIKEAPVCIQETSSIVANIYTFLQDSVCKCDDDGRTDEEDRNVLEILRSMNFVLCDDGVFRECSTLAFDYSGPNGPYLFASPPRHSRVRKLLKRCGVKSEFEVVDYLNTLYLLKEKYRGKPLKESDLDTAKAMMAHIVKQWISDRHKTQSILQDNQVFVPDNSSILRTPCELTLGVPDLEESHEDVHVYTHSCVTTKEAEVFGIMTQKERQLEACSSSAGFEMEFGQHEELVDRLRSILVSYPNISDVFKELLQNADDAKATEVHFVYDPRSHETGKIISETWAPIQRMPSLCVYNDKPFSEADISGIQKVGIGAKRDDITAAGRFGIGFSAIYHLTDCPSFFSNCDTLCVFDPLLKYVQGTREKKAGKRFSTGEHFRKVCSDMLRGYLVDTEEFSGMKGTMFRFPLRTEPSKISKRVYGLADVQSLLEQFQVIAQDGLLFLNNVKKITISCVDEQANKLNKRFSINATFSDDDQNRRLAITKYIELYNTPGLEIAPVSYVYSLQTCDSEDTKRSWLISQRLGFQDPAINGQDFSDTTGLKKPLPRGGVAALIKDNKRVNPKHDRHKSMKAYCLLPLPISTNLPVHVNGAFELDPIRRHLLKGDTGTKTGGGVEDSGIHRWNQQLVQNVIAPAYAKLLQHAGQKLLGDCHRIK